MQDLGLVKREAGEIPALTRSGDGNEQRKAKGHALFSFEDGKRRSVGSPKSEDRPAATTAEETLASPTAAALRTPVSSLDRLPMFRQLRYGESDDACA